MPLAKLSVKCSRCLKILDPEQELNPYAYGGRGGSKLCKKCVHDLGLGKNMDGVMGALTIDESEEKRNIDSSEEKNGEEAECPSLLRKAAIICEKCHRKVPRTRASQRFCPECSSALHKERKT
jgi:ssDNA-binding Zn-finger/Zn-ribbon topoisomerase 1